MDICPLWWMLRFSRVFIGIYMLVTGAVRVITGNSTAAVNIFSARVYGLAMVLAGLVLLATAGRWRCGWYGRLAAIGCAAIWLLLIANAWPTHAWVSITGACLYVVALIYEVTVHEC
jgi:hypothetical protein